MAKNEDKAHIIQESYSETEVTSDTDTISGNPSEQQTVAFTADKCRYT